MKHVKEAAILGVGFLGGFITCSIMVVKTVLKTEILRTSMVHTISDKVTNVLYGVNKTNPRVNYRVSYRDYYNDKYKKPKHIDAFIFDTRKEAETVMCRICEILDFYGVISVSDLYDLVGVTGNYTDYKYGWTDVTNMYTIYTKHGYELRMPKAIYINNK